MRSWKMFAARFAATAGVALCCYGALPASAQTALARLSVSDVHIYAGSTELDVSPGSWYVSNVADGLWDTDGAFLPAPYPGHVENQRPGESLLAHLATPRGESTVESILDRDLSASTGLWSVVQSVGTVNDLPANSWITMTATLTYDVDDGGPTGDLGAIVGAHFEAHYMNPLFSEDWHVMGNDSGTLEWTGTFFNTDHSSMGWHVKTYALVGEVSLVPEPAGAMLLLSGLPLVAWAMRRRPRLPSGRLPAQA